MPADPSSVYGLIFHFLETHGLNKTLRAFKKETGLEECSESDKQLDLVALILGAQQQQQKKETEVASEAAGPSEKEERRRLKHARKRQREEAKEDDATTLKQEITDMLATLKEQQSQDLKEHHDDAVSAATPPKKRHRGPRHSAPGTMTNSDDVVLNRIDAKKCLSTIKDQRLLDQSFQAKRGDTYAARAADDLGKVRGKDFRKEMQKKKRASWKGCGPIEDKINSIKFDSD